VERARVVGQVLELRGERGWAWGRAFGEPCLLLLSHELVQKAFMAEDVFPSADFYSLVVTDVLGRNLQCMKGDEHKRNRALVSPAFRSRLMPGLVEPLLEPVAHELLDRVIATGEADLVADFTHRYPFIVITRLLGLPEHSEEEIRRWAITMLDVQQSHGAAVTASREFMAYVDPILQQRRVDPGDDLLSTLATTEVEGERLTDEEIFNFLRLLFPAGADTTYLGLGNTLHSLLTNPDQLELVLADLDTECRWAAEEGIRLNPPTTWIPRRNTRAVTWEGIDVPEGASMMLGVMAANRDPAVFEDPDEFRVQRRPQQVTTFGFGTHFCLGAHLARAELATSLQVILSRLQDLRLRTTDGVRITGTIHHLLRGPTSLPVSFRVA
jgi:cytochrome P450